MAFFLISYDLVKDKDYKTLIDEIKRIGGARCELSAWFVEQNMTAFALRDHLKKFIDDDDKLVVIEFSKKPAYTISFTTGADWIRARFP